jgi:hypothetical protein
MSPDAEPAPDHDEGCSGCGGRCAGATPGECRGPSPLPWLPFDRCMFFYEARVFTSTAIPISATCRCASPTSTACG